MAYRDEFVDKDIGGLGKIVLSLAHPVLGLLSSNIQCRSHKTFGGNNYSPQIAGLLSGIMELAAGFTVLAHYGSPEAMAAFNPDTPAYIGFTLFNF
ncbi:MAG: hypothetical protein KKA26_00820 [Nanoarchaeota archaeon]|nr:hypothetical protein [Nanoarchaeota archaeon]